MVDLDTCDCDGYPENGENLLFDGRFLELRRSCWIFDFPLENAGLCAIEGADFSIVEMIAQRCLYMLSIIHKRRGIMGNTLNTFLIHASICQRFELVKFFVSLGANDFPGALDIIECRDHSPQIVSYLLDLIEQREPRAQNN